MTENDSARVSSQVSDASIDASATKQRRKRKWDQPDESLISTCVSVPGILPFSSVGIPASVPGLAPASCALWTNPLAAIYANTSQVQAPIIQQQATAVVQKLNQPKIQEELIIAREIVINDADPAVRYKLTKRQTQEEIQKCTGAVVITRGKYRPPNAVPDGEKPLYLHISAAANLKETAERILAVDRAAAMVEEMLKGHNLPTTSSFSPTVNSSIKVSQPLSTCVYLGFDADPSLDIPARIRGPNDQYINHIMNETGAKVFLRGQGSGNHGSIDGEEGQQPLHLFLSCNNQKGLEDARLLAENLLETISRDCGATRVPSGKIYKAVPPPEQLLTGVQSLGVDPNLNPSTMASLASSGATLVTGIPVPSYTASGVTTTSYGLGSQSNGLFSSMRCQANEDPYSQPLSSGCSSYNGYAGVYPHATPLHQVALALRQASPVILTVHSATSATNAVSRSSGSCPAELTKRPPQKRKFQESPVILQETAVNHQGSEVMESSNSFTNIGPTKVATSPLPKKLGDPPSNGVLPPFSRSILPTPPPPPPRSMPPPSPRNVSSMPPVASRSMAPPPPPPPKFSATVPVHKTSDTESLLSKSKRETVPDTLVKLMEYGDDEDDDDEPHENEHESFEKNTDIIAPSKPFWAV